MKTKAPTPNHVVLDGDASEPQETPVQVETKSPADNIRRNLEHMRLIAAKGFAKRAVVVHEQDSWVPARMADPSNWGIIIDTAPMDNYPLRVAWIDGKQSLSDASELKLVYPCATEAAMISHINGLNGPKQ